MWPAENIMQSMWPAVLYRFPTPALRYLHVCRLHTDNFAEAAANAVSLLLVNRIESVIFGWYNYIYDVMSPFNEIRDGGNDMYDGGNEVNEFKRYSMYSASAITLLGICHH